MKTILTAIIASAIVSGGLLGPASMGGSAENYSAELRPFRGAVAQTKSAVIEPAVLGFVFKVLTTKAACENYLRIMPDSADFKCLKLGKVHVVVPKDVN